MYILYIPISLKAADEKIVKASAKYGVSIDASVEQGNVFACQFHPEKSSEMGLKILEKFCGTLNRRQNVYKKNHSCLDVHAGRVVKGVNL